jgi:hypothetical protein
MEVLRQHLLEGDYRREMPGAKLGQDCHVVVKRFFTIAGRCLIRLPARSIRERETVSSGAFSVISTSSAAWANERGR